MNNPTVTLIESTEYSKRYRIEGGDLAPDWARSLKPGRVAWCEIAVYTHQDGSRSVGSFGGEVWLGAWPALFTCHKGNAVTGAWVDLTEAGKALLDAAPTASEDAIARLRAAGLGAVAHRLEAGGAPIDAVTETEDAIGILRVAALDALRVIVARENR